MGRTRHTPETIEVKISTMDVSGMARGKDRLGRTVLVWGGVPGDTVRATTYGQGERGLLATARDVITPSSDRVEPEDDHYLSCSPWQVVSWEKELEYKLQIVRDIFASHGLQTSLEEVITDNQQYNCRNKQEYVFTEHDDTIELAIYKRGRQEKIPIQHCALVDKAVQKKAADILEKLRYRKISSDHLANLVVRSNRQGDTQAVVQFTDGSSETFGKDLSETLLGKKVAYSAADFFQGNTRVFEQALKDIQKHAQGSLVDFFAGVGAIGIAVADHSQEVTFVESNKEMCEKIHRNCLQNSLEQAEVICSDASEVCDILTPEHTIILDPPREGLSEKLVRCLQSKKPHKILYLSCNPQTQARDCKTLKSEYKITEHKLYNFFPRTQHCESFCVLEIQ